MASKKTGKRLDVVDVLKPVFGKTQPRAKLREIRKEITEKEFEKRASAVLKAWETDRVSAKDFGDALLDLKASFYTHGQFTKWLRANGVDQNRASYCVRKALNKVEEAQKKRKVYLTTIIKKEVDDLLKTARRKTETLDQLSARIDTIVGRLCAGIGQAAGWPRKADSKKLLGTVNAFRKYLDAILNEMYVTYEQDENGNIVESGTGRSFSDVGSAVGAKEAAAASAGS